MKCNHCNKEMTGRKRKYCDKRCCDLAYYHRNRQYYREQHLASYDVIDHTTHCLTCGEELEFKNRGVKRYCSLECRYEGWKKPAICEKCKREFLTRTNAKRCSDCQRFTMSCAECGKQFEAQAHCALYCSGLCSGRAKRKRKPWQSWYASPAWRDYKTKFLTEHTQCIECGEQATLIDHIKPFRGNLTLFWSPANHAPMCMQCHNKKSSKEHLDIV